MHCTRRAPLLSATSRLVSVWITLDLLWPRDQPNGDPALGPRERTALPDLDHVRRAVLARLVVRVEPLTTLDVLAVDRIAVTTDDFDDHGLLHATGRGGVVDDPSDQVALEAATLFVM